MLNCCGAFAQHLGFVFEDTGFSYRGRRDGLGDTWKTVPAAHGIDQGGPELIDLGRGRPGRPGGAGRRCPMSRLGSRHHADESAGLLLWQVTNRWQAAQRAVLKPFGLTHVQFVLLACAWWLGRSAPLPNQLDVARQAGTDPKMTSEVLRRLEAKGLLVRTVDPADTRVRRIEVTPAGGRATASCRGRVSLVRKVGSRAPRVEPRQWTFALNRINDSWLIQSVISR